LLAQGAPLHITTAAMLDQPEHVQAFLAADPGSARAQGAHRISLLAHAVYSMNAGLMQMLLDAGAERDSRALFAPVAAGRVDIVVWLLEHGATDVSVQNFKGQTPVDVAEAAGHEEIVRLLRRWAHSDAAI
jgi:ankyrin repeat protein